MNDTPAAVQHFDAALTHHRRLLACLQQAPTPLSVFQRMAQRLDADPPPLERLPKAWPARLREYRRSAAGQANANEAARALGDLLFAQAELLHADRLLSIEHRLMAKSVHQWPAREERARYFGGITRAYALSFTQGEHVIECVGSFVLAQSAHTPLAALDQAQAVGKLLLFTPGAGLEPLDDLGQLRERLDRADALEALAPGLRARDRKRLGGPLSGAALFSEITDALFSQVLARWGDKQLDDFAYHLRHRDQSPLQGLEWVTGLARAVDLIDAFGPQGFFARRTAALLHAASPAWLHDATPRARQALALRTRAVIKHALVLHDLMKQLPSLKAFATARVQGELRRRLGRRINIERLYVSEARVLGLIPQLWKGLPWLIYSEVKRGRDVTALVDKALINISPADVDYRLTAIIVDEQRNLVPDLDPGLIRDIVREVDVGGSYAAFIRGQIDTAAHLKFHGAFARLERARHAVHRQRQRMGAPADPAWTATLVDSLLTEQGLDAAFEAHIDTLMAQADAASTSDRESNVHVAITLCSLAASAVATAVNPWLGLAVNGLLSAQALVEGVKAWQQGRHEQAVDAIGGALAGLIPLPHGPALHQSPVALFRDGTGRLQPRLMAGRALDAPLAHLAEAKVDLAGVLADDDGVFHHQGRHYLRAVTSPTLVHQLQVDYSPAHASYRMLEPHRPQGARQPIRRTDGLAWRLHAPALWSPELELPQVPPPAPAAGVTAVIEHPHQWVDPALLAQAGLEAEHEAAFIEAAQWLEQGRFQFAEHEILPPALPSADPDLPDLFAMPPPLVFRPQTLSIRQVAVPRTALESSDNAYQLPATQVQGFSQQLANLQRERPPHGLEISVQRERQAALATQVMTGLGYQVRDQFTANGVELLVCRHPASNRYYIVLPRMLYSTTKRFYMPGRLMGLGKASWEEFILGKISPRRVQREVVQARLESRLSAAFLVVDVGEAVADTRIFLSRAVFEHPGAP